MNILIFGTSKGREQIEAKLNLQNVTILGYVDNNQEKQNTMINNRRVIAPKELKSIEFDAIIISSVTYQVEIYEQLIELSVPSNKIILPSTNRNKFSKYLIPKMYSYARLYSEIFEGNYSHQPHYYIVSQNESMRNEAINFQAFPDYLIKGVDFVRLSTIELLSKEIKKNNVEGDVAELGVYKGDLTRFLTHVYPDRKFYLFDTFEGFNIRDTLIESENEFSNAIINHLSDTNEDIVLNKVLDRNNVKIIKGYFPDSIPDNFEGKFSFVSIDVDLYQPTKEGLIYFYKNLSKGGYILIHDYNFKYYSGVKAAVDEFAKENNVTVIPVADYYGSVLICK